MVDAFGAQIASAVESAITKKLKEGISKLDSLLQFLPKEVHVDDNASLNVTFVNDPQLSSSSIGFEINGLFMGRQKEMLSNYYHRNPHLSVLCRDSAKMLGITLDEAVFNSASSLYYDVSFDNSCTVTFLIYQAIEVRTGVVPVSVLTTIFFFRKDFDVELVSHAAMSML